MTDRDPSTPSDQSTPQAPDTQAKNEDMLNDLPVADAETLKAGAINAFLMLDGIPESKPNG